MLSFHSYGECLSHVIEEVAKNNENILKEAFSPQPRKSPSKPKRVIINTQPSLIKTDEHEETRLKPNHPSHSFVKLNAVLRSVSGNPVHIRPSPEMGI
jgi:hypothetical protein